MSDYTLWHGDCLEEMDRIEDGSIDCILADLPYGTTACKWDVIIPFEPLWKHYKRVIKKNGAIVLFGSQPFTTELIISNREWFKYDIVWDKVNPSGFLNVRKMPLRSHESILIFYETQPAYNPQMVLRPSFWRRNGGYSCEGDSQPNKGVYGDGLLKGSGYRGEYKNPISIIEFNTGGPQLKSKQLHPTQKPVALLSYLTLTYTNEGDTILDNTCGSGSTLEAAMRNNRRSIGIEKNAGYFNVATQRLTRVAAELRGELNHLPMFAEAQG